jgi:hypothetical protein
MPLPRAARADNPSNQKIHGLRRLFVGPANAVVLSHAAQLLKPPLANPRVLAIGRGSRARSRETAGRRRCAVRSVRARGRWRGLLLVRRFECSWLRPLLVRWLKTVQKNVFLKTPKPQKPQMPALLLWPACVQFMDFLDFLDLRKNIFSQACWPKWRI